jgi:hypothetical protein
MTPLLLASLFAAPSFGADPSEMPADVEIRREMEKAESENLENAAAAAEGEAAKAFRFIRGLLAASVVDLEAARVEVEGLLRDPEQLRRQLGDASGDPVEAVSTTHESLLLAGQMLVAKSQDFMVKASSVPLTAALEDQAKLLSLRASYSAKNRSSDLTRALVDSAAAKKRLGVLEPWGSANEALTALGGCIAEVRDASAQAAGTVRLLAPDGRMGRGDLFAPARETLLARSKVLAADAKDLERETELLRSNLLLQKADRQITGQPSK